jgi:hypothetical protein
MITILVVLYAISVGGFTVAFTAGAMGAAHRRSPYGSVGLFRALSFIGLALVLAAVWPAVVTWVTAYRAARR